MLNVFKIFIKIFPITIFIFLLCDVLFGVQILEKFYWQDKEDFRIEHKDYHHTIKKNYNGNAFFGGKKYKFCSDGSGFKSSCNKTEIITKNFDIAFIGDSFTEGLGIPYEETFVGIISKKFKDKKIANLGVSGYSPSIYLIKIKKLLELGYNFKEVVIYIDINDIYNEANSYEIINDLVVPLKEKKEKIDYLDNKKINRFEFKKIFKKNFRFTYENLHLLKMAVYRVQNKKIFPYVLDLDMGAWTYNNSVKGYGELGLEGSIIKAKDTILELIHLLENRGIYYSIGVYPYPQTLFYDQENSKQVSTWKDLCELRCKNFYNNFPLFFKKAKEMGPIETYYKYYIYRDVHFNKNGHIVIAENFIKNYLNEN